MTGKILLAEDEEHIAKLVVFKLSKAGYECVWAKNGQEAVDHAQRMRFDLLILDIMMPILDGWSVLQKLADLNIDPFPRVIMLSARSIQRDLAVATRVGVKHYMRKPFNPNELLMFVEKVLSES